MPLSDTAIRNAKPQAKPFKMYDAGGLFLIVTPNGGKWWRLKYRFGGKEKLLSLGVYPDVSLKDARRRRDDAREMLADGVDPSEQRKAAKAEAVTVETAKGQTFEAVAREWYEKKQAAWTPGHQKHILHRLEHLLFPYLGNVPIADLEAVDFLAAIQKVEARGAIETAHRLAQLCGQVTRYARISGMVKHDVAAGLTEALTHVQTRHYAAITDPAGIGRLLRDIDAYHGEPTICHALRILPYVFVRSGELRAATWEEIDLDAATWVVPAGRMKMRRPHIVPLSPQVVKLFRSMLDYSGPAGLVFPSTFSATRCISDVGLLNALRRMGYGKETMTIHGFRGMASTLLNEQGYRPDVIEAQLAHGEKNSVPASYNHAEYLPERRAMMEAWANYLDALRDGAELPRPAVDKAGYA